MSAKTISLFDTCVKMNVNVDKIPKKRHWNAFACLLFFILGKRLFKDNVNKPCHMHLPYFYLLHGILQLRKELTRRGFKNMLKLTKKNIQGKIIKTISFSFSFSILQLFYSPNFSYFSPTIYSRKPQSSRREHQSPTHFHDPAFPRIIIIII